MADKPKGYFWIPDPHAPVMHRIRIGKTRRMTAAERVRYLQTTLAGVEGPKWSESITALVGERGKSAAAEVMQPRRAAKTRTRQGVPVRVVVEAEPLA